MWPALRVWVTVAVALVASAAAVPPSAAQAPAAGAAPQAPEREAAIRKARDHFQKGQRLFTVSRYREALEEFKEGFVSAEDPVFLYNIAQCHRLLREPEESIRFYRRYLEAAPNAPERARAEKFIAEMEAARAAGPAPGLAPSPVASSP